MNDFTTRLVRNLLNNDNNLQEFENVLSELFRQELETAVNDVLKVELTEFLGYEKYAHTTSEDSRNGYYPRTLNTKYGTLNLKIPRDRMGLYSPVLVPGRVSHDKAIAQTVTDLFDLGMTDSDIVKIIEKIYGKKYSKQTVSNISDVVVARIKKFRERRLASEYAVIYLDATFMAFRRDTVAKEAVHIALGIRTDGTKEIIAYAIAPTESKSNWCDILDDIRQRGVERVALFCTDGLNGMEEAINERFHGAKIQRCILHVERNISAKVRVSDRAEVLGDFKKIAHCDDKASAERILKYFKDKWMTKYPKVIEIIENNDNLLTFYEFPKAIWRSIYTTNMIEGYNKQLKRKFKLKEQFPSERSEEKYLVSQFEQYNQVNLNRVHKGFGNITTYWFNDNWDTDR